MDRRAAWRGSKSGCPGRAVPTSFSDVQRQLLVQCLGEEDYFSADSDSDSEEFLSPPGSPSCRMGRRLRFLLSGDSEDEDNEEMRDEGPGLSLEKIYGFDAEEIARLGRRNVLQYVFIDDDEEDGCTDGIEQIYSFDLEKVAEALRRGADEEELSVLIEEAMVMDLPRRLSQTATEASLETSASTQTPCTGDVSALMTPPRGPTPPVRTPGDTSSSSPRGVSSSDLAARLHEIRGEGRQRRRSSIAQHPQLMEAVSAARARHRQSLAKALESEVLQVASPCRRRRSLRSQSEVVRSVADAERQRRASLIRAAEVLEAAGVGVGQAQAQAEVMQNLDAVVRALDTAVRRHRKCILTAISRIHPDEEEPEPEASGKGTPRDRPEVGNLQDYVNEIMKSAYEALTSCFMRDRS